MEYCYIEQLLMWFWNLVEKTLPLAITAWIAMTAFYRQREYEAIKERYLDGGIDVAATGLSQNLNVLRNNWARLLYLLKEYKTVGGNFDVNELQKGFLEVNLGDLEAIANQRIHYLTNSDVFWTGYQKTMAFCKTSDDFIRGEAPKAIAANLLSDNKIKMDLIDTVEKQLDEIDLTMNEYHTFTSMLVSVGQIFERQKYRFEKLAKFSDDKDVKDIIKTVNEILEKT